MPHYFTTPHAIARFRERFPELADIQKGDRDCGRWIANLAQRAQVVGCQAGMDLMLRLELPTKAGKRVCFLPVAPDGHHDHWSIKTVLSEDQGVENLTSVAERHERQFRASWRQQKGFKRPDWRSGRGAMKASQKECAA